MAVMLDRDCFGVCWGGISNVDTLRRFGGLLLFLSVAPLSAVCWMGACFGT